MKSLCRTTILLINIYLTLLFNDVARAQPVYAESSITSSIVLTSRVFRDGGRIPANYTCSGHNDSPPLSWEDPPPGTQSFAILCEDPGTSSAGWVHWIIYDIARDVRSLPAGVPAQETLREGAKQGRNALGKTGYGGRCLPGSKRLYSFTLYALDRKLPLDPAATKDQVIQAMKRHVLAWGRIRGLSE